MKQLKIISAVVAALLATVSFLAVTCPAVIAAQPTEGLPVITTVPSTMAFQGYLTDPSSAPVNGTVNLDFSIYSAPTGGAALWTEARPSVTVSNGVFQVALGAVTPLSGSLFDGTPRYLGIRVNGEAELPRSELRTSPFAFRAGSADVVDREIKLLSGGVTAYESVVGPEGILTRHQNTLTGRTTMWSGTASFGGDGLIWVLDRSGSLKLSLEVAAGGGKLFVDGASQSIFLQPGLAGNSSVLLPADAIAAAENLDEPGVAGHHTNQVTLSGPLQSVLSRTITPPANGFILAMAGCFIQPSHVAGTTSQCQFGLSDDGVSFGVEQDVNCQIPSSAATGVYRIPGHVNAIFAASAGVAKTIHLMGQINTGGPFDFGDITLSLLFVPTAYGQVTPTLTSRGGGDGDRASRAAQTPAEIAAERVESERWNAARMERELADIQAQVAEFRQELARSQRTEER